MYVGLQNECNTMRTCLCRGLKVTKKDKMLLLFSVNGLKYEPLLKPVANL